MHELRIGDNLEILKDFPDNYFSSIVTDPPYGLTNQTNCLGHREFEAFVDIKFPNFDQLDSKFIKYSDLVFVLSQYSNLGYSEFISAIKSRVCMPIGSINFQSDIKIQQKKVDTGAITSGFIVSDPELGNKIDSNPSQFIGDFIFDFGDTLDLSALHSFDNGFGNFSPGFFTTSISSIGDSCFPSFQSPLPSGLNRDRFNIVFFGANSFSETESPPFILTFGGTIDKAVLTFDTVVGSGKILLANGADQIDNGSPQFICPKLVRTRAGASCLSSMFQSRQISFILITTNGACSFYFHLWAPPSFWRIIQHNTKKYKGFMNKNWDGEVPNTNIMKELYRVLKPGGHMLCCGGARTYHRLVTNIEKSGFEIRDSISCWLYGSGFPKSQDISKAIDKQAGVEREVIGIRSYLREGTTPVTRKATSIMTKGSGENVGQDSNIITAPPTEATKQWEGYGTALKPAMELWCLARKPLSEKTIAANVLKHGTGGLDIDGSRIGLSGGTEKGNPPKGKSKGIYGNGINGRCEILDIGKGRWPANTIFCHHPECKRVGVKEVASNGHWISPTKKGLYNLGIKNDGRDEGNKEAQDGKETVESWDCHPECQIRKLDEQSGVLKSGRNQRPSENKSKKSWKNTSKQIIPNNPMPPDQGGASRFFKNISYEQSDFFYCAKASSSERGKFNNHPTVKPLKLMKYLIKLITPPNGIILDPYGGSGTTGVAAIEEGFDIVLIEKDKDSCEIINKRIENIPSNCVKIDKPTKKKGLLF